MPPLSFFCRNLKKCYICIPGALAEWLGTGLQNLLQQFDSARHLKNSGSDSGIFCILPPTNYVET